MAITKIFPLLSVERIAFLPSTTKENVINELAQMSEKCVTDVSKFEQTILEREAIVSTGIGQGFVIPHVKNEYVPNFFITIGVIHDGVDWSALDNRPVEVVFMIGGPDGMQYEYLSVLSKLSLIIKNPKNKEAILKLETPQDVLNFFEKF